ncbi:MAG: helix-turn-helix transcriptional regulator [Bdellovibrionaceae bacterium]|nr:helix-turn-helix transcriptional regulator [Pseudobdellovibrionaceae bacterium]
MKKSVKKPINLFNAAKSTGDLIKAFRANFDIKQDDMAHACKISQANFSAIEKNRREVGPRIALRLAAFMGLSPDVILYPNGYQTEPEYKEVRERFSALTPLAAKGRS